MKSGGKRSVVSWEIDDEGMVIAKTIAWALKEDRGSSDEHMVMCDVQNINEDEMDHPRGIWEGDSVLA